MQSRLWFLCLMACLAVIFSLAGCLPVSPPPDLPADTPLPPTPTPTATVDWFPPTPTLTPLPAVAGTATAPLPASPLYGDLLLQDDFNDPTTWSTGRTGSGGVAFGNNELTLAINRANGYLYSLHKGADLDDFYLEITANPTICRGDDEYGLLLRVSPGQDFYRFSLTCAGEVRVDKLFQGKASSPQALTPSGAAPRGAPSQSRLGVLARGRELSFFINGEYQFTLRDPSLTTGALGVFARAAGEDAVTVNFSDLKIYKPTP